MGNVTSTISPLATTVSNCIKNITRSGTTFTATRASGGTFTFTQQDNNTTYSNATTSTAGLMSTADKTKLDKIKFRIDKNVSFNTGVATISDSFITDLNVGVISCLAFLNSAPHLHLVTQVSNIGKFNVYARGANASDQPSSSSKFTIYSLLYRI